ncbi:MAG: hypothetical protein AAFX78_01845 [Cyanobacteria bacterium J06638_20]
MGQSVGDYAAYRQRMLEEGLEYQDFVQDVLGRYFGLNFSTWSSQAYQQARGEGKAQIEIKYDRIFRSTSRFWVEVSEKPPKSVSYIASGINRPSMFYVMGDYKSIFLFPTRFLRRYRDAYLRQKKPFVENSTKTSQGFFLPMESAEKIAAALIIRVPDGWELNEKWQRHPGQLELLLQEV